MKPKLGIQLYTLRNELEKDYAGIMHQVAEAGYVGVEPAGFPGSSIEEACRIYRDLGLEVMGAHVPLPIGDEKNKVIDTLKALNGRYITVTWGPEHFASLDDVKQTCNQFNEAASIAAESDLLFAFHNHWWEFEELEGKLVYQHMLSLLDESVLFEVDTYWVKAAGLNPATVLQELGKRAPLLHIKDGPCEKDEPMLAVGSGIMDFQAIHETSRETAEWWIVELDKCADDMLKAIQQSAAYIKEHEFAR